MVVRLRPFLSAAFALTLVLAWGPPSHANHCPFNPGNPQGPDWCHNAPPPATPGPTPAPTPQPAPDPDPDPVPATPAPPTTPAPARATPRPAAATPAPELVVTTTPDPLPAFPEDGLNIVTVPVPDDTPEPEEALLATQAAQSPSPAWWAFLIVGFLVGFVAGRASWGLRRRKDKQNLFG